MWRMILINQISLFIILLFCLFIISLFLLFKVIQMRKKIRMITEEKVADKMNFEIMVKERILNLEKIRDSISDYAIQKSELAQELEAKNTEILKQKDDLYKQSDKLQNAYEEIKKLESYRQQMTRMIIHDLKNPLNLIINIAESDSFTAKSGKMIVKLSWGMLDLIMNILEVNKLENMRMKIVMTSFNLSSAIDKMIDKFSFILSNSSVTLKSKVPGKIWIHSDTQITDRIFDNLISNAIKYSSAGGIITISASYEEEHVRIEVRDNGTGIPITIMNEVFNEYVHGENRSFAYSNPTGLGLAYCKLAVEAMQGKIGISSEVGKGTIVWVTLQKGTIQSPSGKQPLRHSAEELNGNPVHSELTVSDLRKIEPLLFELRKTEIHEVSVIIKMLDNYLTNTGEALAQWKNQILKAAYEGDNDTFQRLINIFEDASSH